MTAAYKQLQRREIVTKAVCGKGRKFSTVSHAVTPPHQPTSILGAWIINHQYEAVRAGEGIEVIGTYDVNIWYSHHKNSQTEVAKETLSYVEHVPLSFIDPHHRPSTVEVMALATQEPNCIEATISSSGTSVILRVEREFAVELMAETKVIVAVFSGPYDDGKDYEYDDEDYEDLDPGLLDEEL